MVKTSNFFNWTLWSANFLIIESLAGSLGFIEFDPKRWDYRSFALWTSLLFIMQALKISNSWFYLAWLRLSLLHVLIQLLIKYLWILHLQLWFRKRLPYCNFPLFGICLSKFFWCVSLRVLLPQLLSLKFVKMQFPARTPKCFDFSSCNKHFFLFRIS